MARIMTLAMFAVCLMFSVGCSTMKMPSIPVPITQPTAVVDRVELVDASDVAGRYLIYVTLTNPNDFALPMTDAQYELTVSGATGSGYLGDVVPNATLPGSSSIQIKLPAVVVGGGIPLGSGGRGHYQVDGTIRVFPPGQIKKIGYELGVPRPRVAMVGSGPIVVNLGAEGAGIDIVVPDGSTGEVVSPTDPREDTPIDRRPDTEPDTPGEVVD